MEGALIILAVTIAVGVLLWAWEKSRGGKPLHHHHHAPAASTQPSDDNSASAASSLSDDNRSAAVSSLSDAGRAPKEEICCGLHAICEKTGQVNEPPVYYDDEELDRYAGRDADDYSDAEIEEFRDVLLTLLPSDAPGWAVSLERRRINLPSPLLPELNLLLSEI